MDKAFLVLVSPNANAGKAQEAIDANADYTVIQMVHLN